MAGLEISEASAADWDEIVSGFADHNYEQSGAYVAAMAREQGATPLFLTVRRDDACVGAAAVRIRPLPLLGTGIAYIAGGPLCRRRDDERGTGALPEVLRALRSDLVEKRGTTLLVRPPLAKDGPSSIEAIYAEAGIPHTDRIPSYRTILVDIADGPDSMRRNLAGKWRTDLNFSERQGLLLESGESPDYQQRFLALFNDMHAAKGFDIGVDPGRIFALPAALTGLEIQIASRNGEDAAGHVTSRLGDVAVYLFGATNRLGRETKAGYLLNWQAMVNARDAGCAHYDAGGIDPEANPGVFRFKSRMGGVELRGPGPFIASPGGLRAFAGETALRLRALARKMR